MNRIHQKFQEGQKLLSIYFTAGFPDLEDTTEILEALQESGTDMIEIGLPFSDPLADGPTIQHSSEVALRNGMTTEKLFHQLENIREKISIPLLIMGYFNPILQYGVEAFCAKCREIGIDGLIIPDLPIEEYSSHYKNIFQENDILPIFLVTPQTSEERVRMIDSVSEGFIYLVSSAGVTGGTSGFGEEQERYFRRILEMNLNSPLVVGFGVKDTESYRAATKNTDGAIIGSAFIKHLENDGKNRISQFIGSLR